MANPVINKAAYSVIKRPLSRLPTCRAPLRITTRVSASASATSAAARLGTYSTAVFIRRSYRLALDLRAT